MSVKELMKECDFAQEMKGHMLPTKQEVIGHYFYVRNSLMVTDKVYLKKRPPFNICKTDVLKAIQDLWSKSSLPTIGQKSIETKLKNLINDYAKAKTKQDGITKLELHKLFHVSSCKCFHQNPIERYGKICCSCAPNKRIPSSGKKKYNR